MRIRELVFSLALLFPLTGCLETAVGAGAVGAGYIANQEITRTAEKRRAKVEREERRKYEDRLRKEQDIFESKLPSGDERAEQALTARLLGGQLTHVLSISPRVENGVVTLYGVVPSPVIADRAVAAASQIPGIRGVNSQLMINERRIEPILGPDGKPVRPPYAHRPNRGVQQQPDVMRPVRPDSTPPNVPPPRGARAPAPAPPQLAPPPTRRSAPPPAIVPLTPLVPNANWMNNQRNIAEDTAGGVATASDRGPAMVVAPPPPGSLRGRPNSAAPTGNRGVMPLPAPVPPPPGAANRAFNNNPPPSATGNRPPPVITSAPRPNYPPPSAIPPSEVTVTPSQPARNLPQNLETRGIKLKQLERPPMGSSRDHWYPKYIQEGG